MIKGAIQQKDITIVNIYAPNIGTPKYVKQILIDIKGEIDSNSVSNAVGNFNTPLTSTYGLSRNEVNEEMVEFNDTLDKMDLIHIFRAFQPKAAEYAFFSSAHETFSRIDHMLEHKKSLNKFKKIEIISGIFSDHNGMKLASNHKKKTEEYPRHGG